MNGPVKKTGIYLPTLVHRIDRIHSDDGWLIMDCPGWSWKAIMIRLTDIATVETGTIQSRPWKGGPYQYLRIQLRDARVYQSRVLCRGPEPLKEQRAAFEAARDRLLKQARSLQI